MILADKMARNYYRNFFVQRRENVGNWKITASNVGKIDYKPN
jgi:hypothetical protein